MKNKSWTLVDEVMHEGRIAFADELMEILQERILMLREELSRQRGTNLLEQRIQGELTGLTEAFETIRSKRWNKPPNTNEK